MSAITGIAHFSIPVSNMERSQRFYSDIVGFRHLFTTPPGHMAFMDAGGICIILVKHSGPINPVEQDAEGVHHSFAIDQDRFDTVVAELRAKGVEVILEEDRQGGIVNGPRVYFRDPDGTVLEFIKLTSYKGAPPTH